MPHWTIDTLSEKILDFGSLNDEQQQKVLALMNTTCPPSVYEKQCTMRRNALAHSNRIKELLASGRQDFPPFVTAGSLTANAEALSGFAIVFTAGGEGERLRLSLEQKGIPKSSLADFTKATFGLPGFPDATGTLSLNLRMVADLCAKTGIDIPVIVTTGPYGSVTARVIPELIQNSRNFGLKHLFIIEQDERYFLTNDEQIVLPLNGTPLKPITHPDETGGPIMKLKSIDGITGLSVLDRLQKLGCTGTIIVQATALYDQSLLPLMATALGEHDCLGVGILRKDFPESDPYGTFVSITSGSTVTLQILEQDVRNDDTRTITDASHRWHLPFNTGFYAFRNRLLETNSLPDFATPPKELRPDLPRAPKIGYAATDLIALARNPVVLTIDPSLFGVLKNADDLEKLSAMGKKFGLARL
ncbi:MAG: hypothetical protein JW863_12430 [Chitinispirillaceae bacterium]|nr:hypothetical protein [Chitinispirillaceae bacterium]